MHEWCAMIERATRVHTAATRQGALHLGDQVPDHGLELLEEAWCHCRLMEGEGGAEEAVVVVGEMVDDEVLVTSLRYSVKGKED